jgi:hypothetical protein
MDKFKNLPQICNEKIFIEALYQLLIENNYCFLRGAFVFEDNNENLFNLLTEGSINSTKYKQCPKITRDRGTICFTSHNDFILNKKFQKKRKGNPTILTIDDNYTKKKLTYKYTIPPLSSISMYEKIIDQGITVKCDKEEKKYNVILLYPFKFKEINNIFLYIKLEESRCLSFAHIYEFILSQKINKSNLNTRREKNKYTVKLYKNDIKFYMNIIEKYFNNDEVTKNKILNSVEQYNDNIRIGSEFFIPTPILNILFNKIIILFKI